MNGHVARAFGRVVWTDICIWSELHAAPALLSIGNKWLPVCRLSFVGDSENPAWNGSMMRIIFILKQKLTLVLQAYCLTDADEINPLGIEIWYRTTRRFSIRDGIEAIQLVPKKYWTWYLIMSVNYLSSFQDK